MASEYKISTIQRSETIVKVVARFYDTTVTEVEVTEDNHEQYFDNEIGEVVQEITRSKYSPEFEYRYDGTVTDEQIHTDLYEKALQYGNEIINEKWQ